MVRISDIHENTVAWSSVPFCDIDDWETAKIYADRANKCCNSKNMDELMAVYAGIEKQMD